MMKDKVFINVATVILADNHLVIWNFTMLKLKLSFLFRQKGESICYKALLLWFQTQLPVSTVIPF